MVEHIYTENKKINVKEQNTPFQFFFIEIWKFGKMY